MKIRVFFVVLEGGENVEEKRLPRSGKEGFLYGFVIAFFTANVMLYLNIEISMGGINGEVVCIVLKTLPIMLVLAMALQTFIVGRIAQQLTVKFTEASDGFNARILFTILFSVTGMSIIMTIVGGLIGTGFQSLEPFREFFNNWPRNFCVAFWCEVLLAQPIARKVMKILHERQEKQNIESKMEGGVASEQE